MRYRVEHHPRIDDDLDDIFDMIADYAGEAVADRIVQDITARMRRLADMPHIGTIRDASGLRVVPHEKAVILIRVNDARRMVRVLGVTYGGADWQRRVRARR